MSEEEVRILVSERPSDPEEAKKWASQMVRIQFAMWVDDGAKCAHCGHTYTSTDDMIDRNPRSGFSTEWEDRFVDEACWEAYRSAHEKE